MTASNRSSCRPRRKGSSVLPYTANRANRAESSDQLRARIPGWGADLDPKDRPSVPRERYDPAATGAHWDLPERQQEKWPRERSLEHRHLPPVFGTSTPPKGLSGALRKLSYARYSEGRAAHWLRSEERRVGKECRSRWSPEKRE